MTSCSLFRTSELHKQIPEHKTGIPSPQTFWWPPQHIARIFNQPSVSGIDLLSSHIQLRQRGDGFFLRKFVVSGSHLKRGLGLYRISIFPDLVFFDIFTSVVIVHWVYCFRPPVVIGTSLGKRGRLAWMGGSFLLVVFYPIPTHPSREGIKYSLHQFSVLATHSFS